MGKIILVTGGTRSGKSTFAEEYVKQYGANIAYIATANIFDGEMKDRIAQHKARRLPSWTTLEAPFDAERVLKNCDKYQAVLFDCISLYISNIFCLPPNNNHSLTLKAEQALTSIQLLLDAAKELAKPVIFVTNEVGDGIIPDNALARCYRDTAGLCNQKIAKLADEAYFVVAGLPMRLK